MDAWNTRPRSKRRLRRLGRFMGRAVLVLALVLLALPVVVLVALRFEAPRAFVAGELDKALASVFRGRLHFTKLERVDLGGVRVTGSIDDPSGRPVIRFYGVTVHADVPALLVSVLRGGGVPRSIDIDEVHVPHVEVYVVDDGSGIPTLAHAFDPRSASAPTGPSTPPPTVAIALIRVVHSWVHGGLGSSRFLDADVSAMRATFALEHDAVRVNVEDSRIAGRLEPYALNPRGSAKAALRAPLGSGPLVLHANFKGQVADTEGTADAKLEGNKVTAEARLPAVAARTLLRFSPELALRDTLSVVARAEGTFDELALSLEATGTAGELSARGRLTNGTPLRLGATARGRRWDVSALVRDTPATRLDFDATSALVVNGDATTVDYAVSFVRPRVADQQLPDVSTQGTVRSAASNVSVDGTAKVAESGVRGNASYAVRLADGRGQVDANVAVSLENPPRLVELAGVRTRGKLSASARARFPSPVLEAVADAQLDGVELGAERLGQTRAHVVLDGSASAPHVSVALSASRARLRGRDFTALRASADGTLRHAKVAVALTSTRAERLAASSMLRVTDSGVVLEGSTLAFQDKEGALGLEIARASFGGSRLRIDDLTLHGAGTAHASLTLDGARFRLAARTEELDLSRLARIAGVSTPLREARATVTAELEQAGALDGSIRGAVTRIRYGAVQGGKASFDLTARRDAWSGTLDSELAPGARLVIDLRDFRASSLAGRKLELPEGELRAAGTLDLGGMTPLFASFSAVPVQEAKGRVDLEVAYRRESRTALPALRGWVRTHDLKLVEKRAPTPAIASSKEAIQAAPVTYRGIDFGLDLTLDASRRLTAHVGFYDDQAELLRVDTAAGPWPEGSLDELVAATGGVPIELSATLPVRKLASLPQPVRPLSLRGTVAGELALDGTLRDPHVVVNVRASRLAVVGGRVEGEKKPRVTVIGHAEYRRAGGEVRVIADTKNARVLDGKFRWTGDLVRAAATPSTLGQMVVSGQVALDRFDLETIPALKNRQIEGVVSGVAAVEYGPERRLVSANLVAHPLRAGQATLTQLNLVVDAAPGHLRGALDVAGQGGALRANVASGLAWPAGGMPGLSGDILASLSARQFRLAPLWPLLGEQVNELDGRLNAELEARVQGSNVLLSGSGSLTDGVVQLPAVGQRFEAISARVAVAHSAIVIDDLKAHGVTGQLTGNARVELDEHLALRRLDTRIAIEKRQKLPVTLEGVAVGDAWGNLEAHIVNEPARVQVQVRVPELHLEVPDTDREGVQALESDEQIRIGVRRADAVFTALPIQPIEPPRENPTPVDVNVELGSVWVKKGDLVNAELTGALHVAVAESAAVTGRIDLKGGSLDVSGKRFEIEQGTVTFTGGDPANPTVSAVARWDAPAGYAVYASYTGTARKGRLTLSSEPPLGQDEIVNLILFGTPEGSAASGSGNTAAGAIGVAGSTAARGINRAISDLTRLDIQARVDTSSGSARPELMIPVTRRLSARVSRAIGEPPPGASPDRTFLTLELRLKRAWALSALLGDRGASALDLVWRKHY